MTPAQYSMQFNVGDRVWLHSPVVPPGLSRKLIHPWSGPYVVTGKKSPLVYELELEENRAKKTVAHIQRLKPCRAAAPEASAAEGEAHEFEVERILDMRVGEHGSLEFLVKWKNWPRSAASWEPEHHLDNCAAVLQRFMRTRKAALGH